MLFKILGPLRIADDRGEVVLGGLNRRAVLGYLLLYPNEVVSTSRLLTALWGSGRPASARKMLHNSVSGLRKALQAAAEERSLPVVRLVTRDPGYKLTVDEQQIDLWQFRSLVQRARTAKANNQLDETVTLLREALALWRGPVLADLAEAGFHWPELARAGSTRLDALEDYFDAELARGRHESVLTELQAVTFAEPPRERLLGQFMLALYRCGRQAEALSMYKKAETTLEQTFGTAPGAELRELYQSIRADNSVLLTRSSTSANGMSEVPDSVAVAPAAAGPALDQALPGQLVAERRWVSVLQVRVDPGRDGESVDPEHLDDALVRADEVIRSETERFGGVVSVRLGSQWSIVFGTPPSQHDDARRALLCALAIRSSLSQELGESSGGQLRMVVASGLVLARFRPGTQSPPTLSGTAVDVCHSLLPFVVANEILVNDETRAATEASVVYERAHLSSAAWVAVGVRPSPSDWPVPMIGHDRARETLMDVLDRFLLHRDTEVVTVRGDAGIGKSRLIAEFERMAAIRSVGHQQVPIVRLPVVLDDAALAGALRRCCGVTGDDLPEAAGRKLHDFIWRTAETTAEAEWMITALQPILHRTSYPAQFARRANREAAWWLLLDRIVSLRPLVLIVDDVQFVDVRVLGFVERVTRPGHDAAVLVVADAPPVAGPRRPVWAEAERRATSVTLLPLADGDMEVLLDDLLEAYGLVQKRADDAPRPDGLPARLIRALLVACQGNPALAHGYVSLIEDAVRLDHTGVASAGSAALGALPPIAERMAAERVDRLSGMTRTVLHDAAVAGPAVWGEAVAAACGSDHDTVRPYLDELVRHGFLVRAESDPVSGDTRYEFQLPTDQHVVYSQLPLARRADKRASVIAWIDGLPEYRLTELLRHYRREVQRITAIADCRVIETTGETSATDGAPERDAARSHADEVVRYYVALTETPSWYRARLSSIAGELRVLGNTGRKDLTRIGGC